MKYFLLLFIIVMAALNMSRITGDIHQFFFLASVLLSIIAVPISMAYLLRVFLVNFRHIKRQLKH